MEWHRQLPPAALRPLQPETVYFVLMPELPVQRPSAKVPMTTVRFKGST